MDLDMVILFVDFFILEYLVKVKCIINIKSL